MAKEITMAKQKAVKKVLLSLSMIAPEPQYVTIIGKDEISHDYPILLLDQLGIKEQARLGSMASRTEAIRMTADLTEQVVDELVDMYRTLVAAMMPELPQATLNELPIQHLQAITVVFTEASGIMIPEMDAPEVLGANEKK